MFAYIQDGFPIELDRRSPFTLNDKHYPTAVFNWAEATLLEHGIYKIRDNVKPTGVLIIGNHLEFQDGVVRRVWDTMEIPEDQKKSELKDKIEKERDRRIMLPSQITLEGVSFLVDTDPRSQQIIDTLYGIGLGKKITSDPTTIQFRDATNTLQNLDADDLINMGLQIVAKVDTLYRKSWDLKALVDDGGLVS